MITLIVEGAGDLRALPILLEKARQRSLLHSVPEVKYVDAHGKPYILDESVDSRGRPRGLEGFVRRHEAIGSRQFIVLLDSDKTFPPYLCNQDENNLELERQQMPLRAQKIGSSLGVDIVVCWAKWELESWLIGGLEKGEIVCDGLERFSIRFAIPEDTSVRPRDPKKWLIQQSRRRRPEDYTPGSVECLALHVNVQEAYQRNPTFQEFLGVLMRMGINA